MKSKKGRANKAPSEDPKKVPGTSQGLDWHRLGLGLSVQTTLLFTYLPIFLSPAVRFVYELFIFPQKITDLINRLLDLPVPNPTSPLGRALGALSQMKGLIEGAKEDVRQGLEGEAEKFRNAKQKICDAFDLAYDTETFPSPPAGLPMPAPPPVQREDLDSIKSELNLMKLFITLLVDSLPGLEGE